MIYWKKTKERVYKISPTYRLVKKLVCNVDNNIEFQKAEAKNQNKQIIDKLKAEISEIKNQNKQIIDGLKKLSKEKKSQHNKITKFPVRIIKDKELSEAKNSYSKMQKNYMNNDIESWNPDQPTNSIFKGIGNFDDHNSFELYDKYFFNGVDLENKNMLDFACGAGRNIVHHWHRFNHIDGIDLCEKVLNNAIQWISCNEMYNRGKEIKLYLNNGQDLSIIPDSKKYDIIHSTIAMQHIAIHKIRYQILTDFFRLLKIGGFICIQMAYGEDHPNSVDYYNNSDNINSTNRGCDVRVTNPLQLEKDLSSIGFDNFTYNIDSAPPGSDLRRGGKAIYFKAFKS